MVDEVVTLVQLVFPTYLLLRDMVYFDLGEALLGISVNPRKKHTIHYCVDLDPLTRSTIH